MSADAYATLSATPLVDVGALAAECEELRRALTQAQQERAALADVLKAEVGAAQWESLPAALRRVAEERDAARADEALAVANADRMTDEILALREETEGAVVELRRLLGVAPETSILVAWDALRSRAETAEAELQATRVRGVASLADALTTIDLYKGLYETVKQDRDTLQRHRRSDLAGLAQHSVEGG